MHWQVYMILCNDDSLYTGITTDIDRRLAQHAEGRGAKYFRGRSPLAVVYLEGGHSRRSASSREMEIKGLSRAGKRALVGSTSNEVSAGPRRDAALEDEGQ